MHGYVYACTGYMYMHTGESQHFLFPLYILGTQIKYKHYYPVLQVTDS